MSPSIEQLFQNLRISGMLTSDSSESSKSRLMDIQCPPRQRYDQHYGYRVNRRFIMLSQESKIKTGPGLFNDPMSLACQWIQQQLQLPQLSLKYCIEPEDENDESVIMVLSVCSDEPASFNVRPTQEQITLLTDLLGSPPQWWVSYMNM
ncbi:hypothetical protein DEU56DRAFT_977642 [Suillus clintonianus]|uniref:uncharacterized protein n=1 Tax=Suillus clintonianus TaxID=1904413 RepID=UPI001B867B05|nr:uncharacterized protein DEU56DRAFT_977642 [Suillus clintonianus]KAG2150962.1 hypothetical protein DEU56DRAFT_977642 [Suillus clintonianus]